jgi:hypothetical protein
MRASFPFRCYAIIAAGWGNDIRWHFQPAQAKQTSSAPWHPAWRGTVLARRPMFAPRLKHSLDGRAMRPSDHLVLLSGGVAP